MNMFKKSISRKAFGLCSSGSARIKEHQHLVRDNSSRILEMSEWQSKVNELSLLSETLSQKIQMRDRCIEKLNGLNTSLKEQLVSRSRNHKTEQDEAEKTINELVAKVRVKNIELSRYKDKERAMMRHLARMDTGLRRLREELEPIGQYLTRGQLSDTKVDRGHSTDRDPLHSSAHEEHQGHRDVSASEKIRPGGTIGKLSHHMKRVHMLTIKLQGENLAARNPESEETVTAGARRTTGSSHKSSKRSRRSQQHRPGTVT
ncbi:hypothetical protein WDU94_010559 [Cyamophila willieti]